MKFTTRLKCWFIAAFFLIVWQNNSYAGGFPVRTGSLMLSVSGNYFFANKGWDSLSRKYTFPNNGKYTSYSYSLYAEYGLSKRFTLVALLPYVINKYQDNNFSSTGQGPADLEVGLRYYLANINYKYYFMLQGTAIVPTYSNNPALGYGKPGAELKLSFAGSGHLFGATSYFNIENAVRQYFDDLGPFQYRYSVTYGISLDKDYKNQVSVTAGGIYSTSKFNNGFNPQFIASNKNFAFNQVSLSYGHAFTRQLSLFLSAGKFITGCNTGDGSNASVSLIIRPFQ
ncbi:MAG TPA: hypothetical protein VL490_05085 [Mucilaginibacter sp.]|jgi:hypothetical protein|nr:hypothetical protein [Mucilaginibacter sp.]